MIKGSFSNFFTGNDLYNLIFSLLTFAFGVGSILLINLISDTYNYKHPFFIGNIMFIGEILCLPAYLLLKRFDKIELGQEFNISTTEEKTKEPPLTAWVYPTICDCIGSILSYILAGITTGNYVILKIFQVFFQYIVCTLFHGTKNISINQLKNFQKLGLFLVIAGQLTSGIYFMIIETISVKSFLIAFIISIVTCILISLKFSLEQNIFYVYKIHPMKAVGIEGIFGLGLNTVLLIIACYIPCDHNLLEKLCYEKNKGTLESFLVSISDLQNLSLFGIIIAFCILLGFKNYFDLSLCKESTPYNRIIIDSLRAVPISFLSLRTTTNMAGFLSSNIMASILVTFGAFIFLNLHNFLINKFFSKSECNDSLLMENGASFNEDAHTTCKSSLKMMKGSEN